MYIIITNRPLQVSCLALNGEGGLLASGQTGRSAVVRVWAYDTGQCLSLFQTHHHSLCYLRYMYVYTPRKPVVVAFFFFRFLLSLHLN